MTEMFIKSLKNLGCNITIVEKTFSNKIEEVRKLSISKIFKIPVITSRLIYCLVRNKYDLCFYFLSVKPPSIFVDAFFLFIIIMFRIKYIPYLHAKGLIDLNEKIGWPLLSLVKKAISLSLGAIVLGERLKLDLSHLIPDEYLFVLPNAIPDIKSNKSNINYNKSCPIKILFLSNLMPEKGPMDFLRMAKKINETNKNVQFILAGPIMCSQFYSQMVKFIQNENFKDVITLTGPVYGAKKEALFAECDIFVFPTHDDAFGLVNLEAMRAGLPIVSSDEGSIPEVVIDGVNGFIIDPKDVDMLTDRVLKLVIERKLRIKMGTAGREIYEKKFTIESYQKRLEQGVNFFINLKNKSDAY